MGFRVWGSGFRVYKGLLIRDLRCSELRDSLVVAINEGTQIYKV